MKIRLVMLAAALVCASLQASAQEQRGAGVIPASPAKCFLSLSDHSTANPKKRHKIEIQ
jgi:hypothetical protein